MFTHWRRNVVFRVPSARIVMSYPCAESRGQTQRSTNRHDGTASPRTAACQIVIKVGLGGLLGYSPEQSSRLSYFCGPCPPTHERTVRNYFFGVRIALR